MLAPGENRHSGPGEKSQFRPALTPIRCFMQNNSYLLSSSVSYHIGVYTATGSYNSTGTALTSYSEYKITGPSTAVGTNHNYQIQRTGTSSWGVYVDYTLYRTYSDFATSCDGTDVGLETNYSGSTSDEWNERAFQVLKNGSWSSWSNGTIKKEDSAQGISVTWDSKPTSIFTEKS